MDRVRDYQTLIEEILTEHHRLASKSSDPMIESALVFDKQGQHYLLLRLGWQKDERIKTTIIHIRLVSGKIWIEEDWTEDGIVTDLLSAGVPQENIVLAFHPPHLRQHTEFATV